MDSHQLLIDHISEIVSLDDSIKSLIRERFIPRHLKKKEMLLYKGDVSHHMRFIAEGCLRNYNIDENAQEHILQFAVKGWWINDLYSYLTETPATFFIQALEDSVVLQISKNELTKLFDEAPALERFYRIKFENAYVALQNRTIHGMSKPIEERYSDFRNTYPEIEQRVPQFMIASYLGITPESLSRVRKRMSSK
ncbi:Crp/Fnr family transcriptional regulator [Gracilimonas tropica]|uniref:Crp/Fnr family transcriptional regulator n=1 Tax=Gracilimonas tropica TaxID=454600 RepID=UPI00036441BD|nr:Crp/Fnr family transcriptional regulator [Gracilimonas tropica]